MLQQSEAMRIVRQLESDYARAVQTLREAMERFLVTGEPPSCAARGEGAFCYPCLELDYDGRAAPSSSRAYAQLYDAGAYGVSVSRPDLFGEYLIEQLSMLLADFMVTVRVGRSTQEIPYAYVLTPELSALAARTPGRDLGRWFPTPRLCAIHDDVADAAAMPSGAMRPLALFDALRTDFSLARLAHYTGTAADHFQDYVLLTNCPLYVEAFVTWASGELARPESAFEALAGPGALITREAATGPARIDPYARRHQMPAYHLLAPGRTGVSLVNIGAGPSNAKTVTDHLAVLRPHVWLMIGRCAGLRAGEAIGDYVLAQAYLRDDRVLDHVLPPEIPLPPIAEVQTALARAFDDRSVRMAERPQLRTGTVMSTHDSTWELGAGGLMQRLNQARAMAIDMESATIAGQGFRFRTPYGALLRIADQPLRPRAGPAPTEDAAVADHLAIGLRALDLLREDQPRLHSRKLRSLHEPPFR